jgi:hypothetical protein
VFFIEHAQDVVLVAKTIRGDERPDHLPLGGRGLALQLPLLVDEGSEQTEEDAGVAVDVSNQAHHRRVLVLLRAHGLLLAQSDILSKPMMYSRK